jgi:hypothetical protein
METNKGTKKEKRPIRSRGEIVTDYRTVNEKEWERVEEFGIGERVESYDLPLEISKYRRNEP